MATDASPATCAGHQPSGRRSFRKQRTVNPLTGPARYNFLRSDRRSALGYDRVLSDADIDLLATTAWTSLRPAA